MKILFLTGAYSKKKGGKEIYNYNLINNLKKRSEVIPIVADISSFYKLILYYLLFFIKAIYFRKKIDHIHLGDNYMLPLGILLKKIFDSSLSITLYGLELFQKYSILQKIFIGSLNNCDIIICISNATKNKAIECGVSKEKIRIIPCGINKEEFKISKTKKQCRNYLEQKYLINLKNKKILLTNGRLVKRKGINWFVKNVMIKLDKSYIYLISGEGPEKDKIKEIILKKKLKKRVFLLGRTDFNSLKILYNFSDFFIMPNIKVSGDMEGFGIVVIEAGSCGTPVISSDIEGLKDSVINGKNGWRVKEKDIKGFLSKIKKSSFIREDIKRFVENNFSWENVSKRYLNYFLNIKNNK